MPWFTCHFPRVGHLGSFQIRIIINKAMVTLHNVLHNFVFYHEFQLQTSQCPPSHLPFYYSGFQCHPVKWRFSVNLLGL